MKILVKGARAPAALEWTRRLAQSGATVYAADTMRFPLTRGSKHLSHYFQVPAPADNALTFIKALQKIIVTHNIEKLIPTCEEVFYISKFKDRFINLCDVFCDDFEKIHELHDKFRFTQLAKKHGLPTPETNLLKGTEDLDKLQDPHTLVFKPVYSRFARQTLIRPTQEIVQKNVKPSSQTPWVAQEYVAGKEYCSYGIAVHGSLLVHVCYHPLYRAGQGSGIYFQPVNHQIIENLVTDFVRKTQYHGQIAFDFIETSDDCLKALECNPRAISGVHCLPNINLSDVLSDAKIIKNDFNLSPKMVTLAMATYGLKYLRSTPMKFLTTDFMKAEDVVWSPQDPWPSIYQVINLIEIIWRAITQKINLLAAATADIEWNGNPL